VSHIDIDAIHIFNPMLHDSIGCMIFITSSFTSAWTVHPIFLNKKRSLLHNTEQENKPSTQLSGTRFNSIRRMHPRYTTNPTRKHVRKLPFDTLPLHGGKNNRHSPASHLAFNPSLSIQGYQRQNTLRPEIKPSAYVVGTSHTLSI
jgi:hypothetical protein